MLKNLNYNMPAMEVEEYMGLDGISTRLTGYKKNWRKKFLEVIAQSAQQCTKMYANSTTSNSQVHYVQSRTRDGVLPLYDGALQSTTE